ncbi:hypothetical protein OU995_19925 [Roseateles sp. SL47]|uniref:hypothetical protein n=1 Tax=Roseateles sp. SL47 TaxID=2995138 RepID=UPI002270F73C|nr:hypothetical protein [Roseateles sp. SL47]WAC71836.1 hypothetical protein OU995_19925 [Roseateles sp. SL47]
MNPMHRQVSRPRASQGIALLEALIAAALLATGAAGLARLHTRLASASDEVRHHSEALWLAQQALEQARGQAWELTQHSAARWTGASATFDIQRQTTPAAPDGQPAPQLDDPFPLNTTQVSVTWTDRAGQRHILELETLISSNSPSLITWLTQAEG